MQAAYVNQQRAELGTPSDSELFLATTEEPPEDLIVDDSLDPDRPNPWEAAGQAFEPSRQTDE